MSFLTGTNMELIYASKAAATAKASFTSEVAINDSTALGNPAVLPTTFFLAGIVGQAIRIKASGILSSTATPTYTLTIRLGAAGSTTAAIILGTAAVTTQSGITNKKWTLEGDVLFRTNLSGAASTAYGDGWLTSPAGLASPFMYEAWAGAAQPGTVATVDTTITNYVNVNATCSASSASNSIQLLSLEVWGKN